MLSYAGIGSLTFMQRQSIRTSVSLPKEQHAQLEEIAETNDVSIAWVIRQAVNQFLERTQNEQLTLPIDHLRGGERNV